MGTGSAKHTTFVIEREYPVPPARVFTAWSRADVKSRWLACEVDWVQGKYALDFRVGGRESNRSGPAGGSVHAYDAIYYDIVPNERIVYGYELRVGEARISVSLVTVEIKQRGRFAALTFTEQGVFFNGEVDAAEREDGTRVGLERLESLLGDLQ
jgi:uncharacterized protein YndB with AHSA1/START domain